ncbi:MAG: hypothetical protein K9H26_15150 [Prolixibacteraceae bacterium]|nr:hypothetical protein [Prolixibacteraceae bacterium]
MKKVKLHDNRKKRKALLLLAIGLLATTLAIGQVSESRQLSKSFKIGKSSVVDISNKYGDISLETWRKDSVLVEIFVQVSEKNREKLRKKMNDIGFELTQSGHYIVINTLLNESKNILISEFTKFVETIGITDSKVEINMKLKMPDYLDLRINNKFGNVYIDDYKGDVTIDMSNGKLKAHNLDGYSNIKMSFGDAIINRLDAGTLEIYYGELNLTSARKLRITSKTSDITITEIDELTVNSSRDEYRIRMIDDFETQSSWTDFSISEFNKKSDIRMNYGDLTIENITSGFESIYIDASSTNISLGLDENLDVVFDITTNEEISLPMNSTIDMKEEIDEQEKIIRYIGRTGDIEARTPKLILKTTSGEITLHKR